MNILTQAFQNIYPSDVSSLLQRHIHQYVAPLSSLLPSLHYGELISSLSDTLHSFAREILKSTFEDMDLAFRHSPYRTAKYYVKQTRSRTLITVFGEVTYLRTEYVNRSTRLPYCYVDRKIRLRSHERYDSTIQSLLVETYADHNSMIKVGQLIGDRIASSYSLLPNRRSFCIPRQTVFNILHRFKSIHVPVPSVESTPETLYIMADEKYIHLQREDKVNNPFPKLMVKMAVVFDGRKQVSIAANPQRYQLENRFSFASTQPSFWSSFHDRLNERYDLSKVKQIYLLGDGAPWIVAGAHELGSQDTQVSFALDKFHAGQAIQRMTRNQDFVQLLTHYMVTNMKNSFIQVVDSLIQDSPDRAEKINRQKEYLLTHWYHIQTMYKTVKIGCAMEQAISHNLASVFSSVPKAYSRSHFGTYLSYRMNFLNHFDLRNLYLTALDVDPDPSHNVSLHSDFDFSFFDLKSSCPTYSLLLPHKSYRDITKF